MDPAVARGDEGVNLGVAQDDVARLLRVRQSGETDFPSVAVLNRWSCCAASSSAAQIELQTRLIDAGASLTSRLSRHASALSTRAASPAWRSSVAVKCLRGRCVVGIRIARDQVGLVVGERAVDRDRRCRLGSGAAARQLLRQVLRLEKRSGSSCHCSRRSRRLRRRPWSSICRGRRWPSAPKCRWSCCACRGAIRRARASGRIGFAANR